ncbi:MAG: hypothetical protein QHH19_03150 [Candidatus Thermoplasmatota archaeon]|jgi:hypothetical protein|nr:hypothetical protein [Candidatus Thermoplasmatota archaeon]
MKDERLESEEEYAEEISRIFLDDKKTKKSSDEMLALNILQRFNLDIDTVETMPAFEDHIEPLFSINPPKKHR